MPDSFIHAIPGEIKGLDDRRTDLVDLLQLGDVATPIPPAMARGYGSPPLAALHIGDKAYDAASLLAEIGRRTNEPQAQMSATGSTILLQGVVSPAAAPLVTTITTVQEGTGDPAPDNVRTITPVQTVELRYGMNGESPEQVLTADLPEAVYGGTLDWTNGVLTVDTVGYDLPVADMNNSEDFPGWRGIPNLELYMGSYNNMPTLQWCSVSTRKLGINTKTGTSGTIFISASPLKQSEWKAQYPDLVFQFVFKVNIPYTIQLTPQQLSLLRGDSVLITTGGETTVGYRISLQRYIDDKFAQVEAAVLAMGANI